MIETSSDWPLTVWICMKPDILQFHKLLRKYDTESGVQIYETRNYKL